MEVYDWTDGRLLFSTVIWPALETETQAEGLLTHRQRIQQVVDMVNKGAPDQRWSTQMEQSWLTWDERRRCWVDYSETTAISTGVSLEEEPYEYVRDNDGS